MIRERNGITGDLRDMRLSAGFEIKKHVRRKRMYITLGLAVVIPFLFYLVPTISGGDFDDTAVEFASSGLGFVNVLIIISAAIFVGDAISGDFEKKTGLLLFPTPQRKNSIFIGKYLAAMGSVFLVISVYYLVLVLEIIQIYGASDLSREFLKSFLLALVYSTSVLSMIYFLSSILKRSVTSSLSGFFLLMMVIPILSMLLRAADVDPWFMVTHNADLITDVLGAMGSGFGPGNDGDGGPISAATIEPGFYRGVVVMLAYGIIFFLGALGFANRRRME